MTGANAKIKRIYVGDKQVRPGELVLKQIFDFSTNDWKGFTMTPTQGNGAIINTSGGYCEGASAASSSGSATIWKKINAKRFWGRIKFMHPNSRHGGVIVGVRKTSATDTEQNGADYADQNIIFINIGGSQLSIGNISISANTQYYLDVKFDNGLYTCTLSDINLNPLKTITYQGTETIWQYSGFGGRGGDSQLKTTRRIYEYREAYDNN